MAVAIGDSIQRYPLLRLLVPYACGIVLGDVLYQHLNVLAVSAVGVCLIAIVGQLIIKSSRRSFGHVAFGILASVVYLSLGVLCYLLSRDSISYDWPTEDCFYEARVVEPPTKRARSSLCVMQVDAVRDSLGWNAVRRKVFVYMKPSPTVDSLLPGDVVCFRGRIRVPRNFTDDLTFDYARYVTMEGAAGTVYLAEDRWGRVENTRFTLQERLRRQACLLQSDYLHPAFSDETLGVLSALTLGDKRMLSEEVKGAYTDAGAAHVLALSGLHVGVIYAMLAFVMRGVIRRRCMRWLRELVTIVVLWLFALMVGMSASVVRAVFMCTLYIWGGWISRENSSISVLSLAAFVMLLVYPFYLFNVGFQLSFMAMAAILWLEPKMEILISSHSLHSLLAYPISIICMSLAAQFGTFPLVLHHFGSFPTYFLLTNLLVIPCLNLVLLLSVAWWGMALADIPFSVQLSQLLQTLTEWMNDGLTWIGQWPYAVLHVSDFNAVSVVLTYLFVLFISLFILKKWPRGLVLALAALLGLLLVQLL